MLIVITHYIPWEGRERTVLVRARGLLLVIGWRCWFFGLLPLMNTLAAATTTAAVSVTLWPSGENCDRLSPHHSAEWFPIQVCWNESGMSHLVIAGPLLALFPLHSSSATGVDSSRLRSFSRTIMYRFNVGGVVWTTQVKRFLDVVCYETIFAFNFQLLNSILMSLHHILWPQQVLAL